ncbi:MAG: chromosomal replication initiator protein DnaA [Coprobacillus cateniformis]|uniref:Chromosomal replication initiator protein DnaA n=1 Tax=Longibaculum muris TaxID=1796628 RepID=A0A4V2W425_9FIRM|nr:chromosomal replication initiator protein DnaA [Longibaculum muris]MBS5112328.1 chromosomal replication initiator protein DnaA [Coprobacillus cateniformis]MBS5367901.1 chromosomal replication initiator protein DnaA [Coprobacillus cateniformis]MCR1888972.1 chromosomal replication initiator protein DnaA [Longibaculum muris]MED9811829.1 chromosomal replication initiator protein DnaA [Longibaculum muris]TCV94239.1 chromosomal replication initiator protein [Longibaculum muris]
MNNLDIDWQKTLNLFKNRLDEFGIDKITFDSFFTTLQIRDIVASDVTVTIDTQWSLDVVLPYIDRLEEIYNTLTSGHYHLSLVTEGDYNKSVLQKNSLLNFEDNLNPDLTFENFVVGNSNRIAQNASLAVAMKPGISYSPLFIHSNSGLGKTHLLNAIGNYAKHRDPATKVLFTTSENFVNEYIQSLSNHTIDEFNYKYRHIDILLIDDIQFMATKESSSEIFFNIFNSLISNKKQIVITSDKPPRDLRGMESRLVSRFSSGLTVSIDTPEFETSKAILRKKIEVENVDYPISEDVFDFIATHFNTDVRELEGSLKRLLFYKLICGKKLDCIDLNFALEAFSDTYTQPAQKKELTVSNIKKCVADYYNLTVTQINSKSRTSSIIVARHIAMYLVRDLIDDISFIQIGHEFGGRDHSTVMKACSKVQKKLEKDMNYRQAIDDIKKKLV